ncbi:fumarylacetoacetate hydrolase family protein [Sphaerisporangium viridialbum]|uniref:fumarylacetoacetate hydrolase family protein n=1 Tax=Sphaerisporangium viridialbum TaxID=46189 RepID=UPI003C74E0C0
MTLIEQWDDLYPRLTHALYHDESRAATSVAEIDRLRAWLPPIPRPAKILGVGFNSPVFASFASSVPDHPPFFSSPSSALVGHRQPIRIRPAFGLVHPEPELAVVIGRQGTRIDVAGALDHVFGYTLIDDVSAPALRAGDTVVVPGSRAAELDRRHRGRPQDASGFEHGDMRVTYHLRAKGTDGFKPCGPWIVTRDEIPDPDRLSITLATGDDVRIECRAERLIYSVAEVIAHASDHHTLFPGDIIHVGTDVTGTHTLREIDYQRRIGETRTIGCDAIGTLINDIHQM